MQEEKKQYAGMDLLVFGWVGGRGTVEIVKEGRAVLSRTLPEDFLEEITEWQMPTEPDWQALGAERVWSVGEGGLFAALWQMALDTGCGFRLDLKALPLRQETIEVCEVFDLNPYQLDAGCYLVLAPHGNDMLWRCRQLGLALGAPLTLVGKLAADRDKAIYNGENIRYLDRPKPDELGRFRELLPSMSAECE